MSPPGTPREARRTWIVVALVMSVQAALLIHASRANFVTADEPGHVAAGITNWRYGEFDLYRVNPPLARMLSVLPLLVLDPAEDTSRWRPDLAGARGERQVGQDVASANGANYLGLVQVARLFSIACTLLGSCIIFAWTRSLFGARAALVALVVWSFEPNVLAHGCLVTPDMPATAFGLGAMWMYARLLEHPSWRRTLVAGGSLGLALLMKFTNLYLIPVWLVLALVSRRRARAEAREFVRPRQLASIAAIALLVVNLGYGFRGTLRPLGAFEFTSRVLAGELPPSSTTLAIEPTANRFRGSWLGALPVPVPADYLQGLDVQRHDFEHRFRSYLHGVWRDHGWWYYYLFALGLKVPIGTLLVVLGGLWLLLRTRAARTTPTLYVLLPIAAVLVFVSSQTGFSAHLRYVLPIFPFLAICAGRVAQRRDHATTVALAVLLTWSGVSTLRVYPHTLSYFNEAAGGPSSGDNYLLDSNLDWGQDALALRDWIERHAPDAPLGLAYFGGVDPQIIGLRFQLPPREPHDVNVASAEVIQAIGPHPGLFAVSVNFLRGLPFEAPDGHGAWKAVEPRDFAYFQQLRPIATAGYSIRIYCLDLERANDLRAQLALIPLPGGPPLVDCANLAR